MELNKSLTIMESPKFGKVRTFTDPDGTVLYCAKDVAVALGYTNPVKAVGDHCRGVTKRYLTDSLGRQQLASFLPKGDVIRLITNSHLPAAQEFEHWLFDDVAVQVVDTGAYIPHDVMTELLSSPETAVALVGKWKEEYDRRIEAESAVLRLQSVVEEAAPKVEAYHRFLDGDNCLHIADAAKAITQSGGLKMGQKKLFKILRTDGYLGSHGAAYNVPTQRAIEQGYMKVKWTSVRVGDTLKNNPTPLITPKGMAHLCKKYGGTYSGDLLTIAKRNASEPPNTFFQ